jgi:ribonuclease HII
VKPNLKEEKNLWEQGFKIVAGLDEAGRGPLAGPVVAAAVVIFDYKKIKTKGINDSKKISEKNRKKFYKMLTAHPQIKWGIGIVSEKVIDKINILEATKLAMQKAIENLNADFLLLDGNFKIKSAVPQKSIIAGDQKVISIVMASIIAKVTRDEIMVEMHKKYPQYGFDKHKGYGTKRHFANLEKFGPCEIHRKSFYPVKNMK